MLDENGFDLRSLLSERFELLFHLVDCFHGYILTRRYASGCLRNPIAAATSGVSLRLSERMSLRYCGEIPSLAASSFCAPRFDSAVSRRNFNTSPLLYVLMYAI